MAKSISNEKVLAMTIYEIAEIYRWTPGTRNFMALIGYNHKNPSNEYHGHKDEAESLRRKEEISKEVTLLEAILGCEANRDTYVYRKTQTIALKLIEIGLTRIDSIMIPRKTVTVEMLRDLGKDKILSLDARVLPTVSDIFARNLERSLRINNVPFLSPISVRGLIEVPFLFNDAKPEATIKLLESFGFGYEDGPLFQRGARRKFIEDLMKKEGVTKKTAEKITEIAEKRGWEKFSK